MGLFDKKKRIGLVIKFVDGLDFFSADEDLEVYIEPNENELILKSISDKKKPVIHLSLDKLRYVHKTTEKEIIEKNKSVVGRAVVGTLIAGPLGTIIGGMSGIGSKKKTKNRDILIIGYETDGELKEITLIESSFTFSLDKFYTELKKYILTDDSTNSGRIDL